jgi:hypothetical protein
MNVEFTRLEDDMIQFEYTDFNGEVYGIADTLENGSVVDTLVVSTKTYDEIDHSELFKRIVTARKAYVGENIHIQNAISTFV